MSEDGKWKPGQAGENRGREGYGGVEEEKAEHERKLGDREKMGGLILNISQTKNSQEVESQEKRDAYPRMQGTGGGRWTPPVPPRQLRSRPPFFRGSFRE